MRYFAFLTIFCCTLGSVLSPLAVINVAAQQVYVDSLFAVQRTDAIVYGTAPINIPPYNFDLLLDLYEPVGAGAPDARPGLIFIHGGSFVEGSRGNPNCVRFASAMAGRGYTAVSIDYRLAGHNPVISPEFMEFQNACGPVFGAYTLRIVAAVEDATRALRWMAENAHSLHVNEDSLAIGGQSAGAITSLLAAYAIDDYGVADIPAISALVDLSGGLWSFVANMEAGESPLVVVHGEYDMVVPYSLALAIVNQAAAVGIPCDFYPVAAGHGWDEINIFARPAEPGSEETIFDRIVLFLYHHLDLMPTGDIRPPQLLPTLTLHPCHPNPVVESTEVSFALPADDWVSLAIYNAQGRLVRRLLEEQMSAGWHRSHWAGLDERASAVPRGVYFLRLWTERGMSARRTVVVSR
jgi:acetyl esterase/lipase